MNIAIIDYGAGNTRSVHNALKRLGVAATITNDVKLLDAADGVLLPGVGAAKSAMNSLHASGVVPWIQSTTKPLLGLCLGMQLLYRTSEEGNTPCLGLLPGNVTRILAGDGPVPHMGWNTLSTGETVYFVHSYACPPGPETVATCTYNNGEMAAFIRHQNLWGMQFHPEKSGAAGEQFLQLFLKSL